MRGDEENKSEQEMMFIFHGTGKQCSTAFYVQPASCPPKTYAKGERLNAVDQVVMGPLRNPNHPM